MNKKTISDIDVAGKRALVRVDFNVPLSGKDASAGISVTDDTRIKASLPTLIYLLEGGAALILCSHLGRPKSPADRHLAMDPVGLRLGEKTATDDSPLEYDNLPAGRMYRLVETDGRNQERPFTIDDGKQVLW